MLAPIYDLLDRNITRRQVHSFYTNGTVLIAVFVLPALLKIAATCQMCQFACVVRSFPYVHSQLSKVVFVVDYLSIF